MLDILNQRADKMRSNPTKSELVFKNRLIEKKIRFKFQQVISPYIVDFIVGKTIIEIDGSSHDGREEYDARRTKYLSEMGYNVVRVQNRDVEKYCLKYFQKLAKAKKDKPFVRNKKINPQRERQKKRLEMESSIYETIQMPNGDFKKVKVIAPTYKKRYQ